MNPTNIQMTPKLKPLKSALLSRIYAMPVPGVIELTGGWIPSDPWLRKVDGVKLSHRRDGERYYLFRLR